MKRTTYISIGVFFANVIVAVILLIYLNGMKVNSDEMNYRIDFVQQQNGNLDLEDVHTLEFITKGADADQFYFITPGKVGIKASAVPGKRTVFYPVSDYLKIVKANGILSVTVDLTAVHLKEDNSGIGRGVSLDNLNINIETDRILKHISSDNGFCVVMDQVQLDSLYLTSRLVEVKSCQIQSLVLDGDMNFSGENSFFNDLRIDLDKTHWDIDESKVNTLYLTGSRSYQNKLPKGQCRRLIWEPKSEDAELKVTLSGRVEVVTEN